MVSFVLVGCEAWEANSDAANLDAGLLLLVPPATAGGVCILRDLDGRIMYVGRTNDFDRRAREHRRAYPSLNLVPVFGTDSGSEQRGLKDALHTGLQPPLNKRRPVGLGNPNRTDYYRDAANALRM